MIDALDGRLIALLRAEPRIGVLEASRRLGVARGTVQARLDRLHERGVIREYGPQVDPAALGFDGIMRSSSVIALETQVHYRVDPLVDRVVAEQEAAEGVPRRRRRVSPPGR